MFADPSSVRIDENTLMKTEGHEAGIPHYFVDASEALRLLARFADSVSQTGREFLGAQHRPAVTITCSLSA